MPLAVTAALGLRETPGSSPVVPLVDYLRGRELLLVLDNCEHLLDACASLAEELLRACPRLRVLATSRERLGVESERAWLVPSLSLPDPRQPATAANIARSEAVQLVRERARAVRPSFELTNHNAPTVAQICRRLDGIPLAIELAAARVRVLAVEQIAARLDDRFRLLTGGGRTAPPRHQTLQAAIDWSYQLLSPAERTLLRRLAVFVRGWTLEAAEAICGEGVLDLLTGLVDKSLVVAESLDGEEARYRLLETIRQYANEKLLDGAPRRSPGAGGHAGSSGSEAAALRARHRDWYLAFAERARKRFNGPE